MDWSEGATPPTRKKRSSHRLEGSYCLRWSVDSSEKLAMRYLMGAFGFDREMVAMTTQEVASGLLRMIQDDESPVAIHQRIALGSIRNLGVPINSCSSSSASPLASLMSPA